MPETQADIVNTIRHFIIDEFLPGADPEELTETTPLIAGGILDSLATMKLVTFLEDTYHIEVQAHETDEDHLGDLATIRDFVKAKQ